MSLSVLAYYCASALRISRWVLGVAAKLALIMVEKGQLANRRPNFRSKRWGSTTRKLVIP